MITADDLRKAIGSKGGTKEDRLSWLDAIEDLQLAERQIIVQEIIHSKTKEKI